MKTIPIVCALWGLTLAVADAAPLGTAFTYSGRLKYQNQPANGSFDLQVKLFDAANGGNQVGQTFNVNGLNFVNGLFVTSLDFGGGVFNGTAYWLDIAARPNGNGPFTPLSPRQPVNPAPYALYAPNAGSADTAGTTLANSVSSASIQNNAVTAAKIATGQVVKSLNGLMDNVSLQAGANVTVTPNGNTLTISAGGGGASSWSLTGNAGTTAGANFIGTTDNQPLELKAGNVRALRLESSGPFGFGLSYVNTIGGYNINRVFNSAKGATIAGGGFYDGTLINPSFPNEVGANFGTIGGGAGNNVSGIYATIPGGLANEATGFGSLAAGQLAHAQHDGSFVWSDGTASTYSSGPNSFVVRAAGGVTALTSFLQVSGAGNEQAYFGGDGAGGDVQLGSLNPSISTVALYNAGNGAYMDLYVRTLTITGGADLAEPFQMSQPDIVQGAVVVIDSDSPGRLKLSSEPYDQHVAGIVSGANGINAGISITQPGVNDGGRNVALSGRVYVQADATNAAIKPGDLLTTSSTPGHAMKVTDHVRAQGAILGKAMSALKEGKGMVLVLVTLQ